MSQAMITLERFYDVWVVHLEITDQHLMRRGIDVREKTFGDAVLAMVDKYAEFVPDDPSAQGLLEMLTGSVKPEPINETLEVDAFLNSKEQAEAVEAGDHLRPARPVEQEEPYDGLRPADELRAEAEALGVDVDGRWGVTRLREEIEKARG